QRLSWPFVFLESIGLDTAKQPPWVVILTSPRTKGSQKSVLIAVNWSGYVSAKLPERQVCSHAHTSDPTFSPVMTRRMFPCLFKLKMIMGRLLSLHRLI